ncbi:hypothetical protein MMC14_000625 [Varicellaria rhodocarpa]|nr:hypothetical protein [Varicellaria rhodocarpa]
MDSSTYRRPGAFSPTPSTASSRTQSRAQHQRTTSSESDSSSSSQLTTLSLNTHPGNQQQQPMRARPVVLSSTSSNASSASLHTLSRPSIAHIVSDLPSRKNSPLNSGGEHQRHRRQHSQGFFEPSLPTASLAEHTTMTNLTASQIAAQAAMQHQSSGQHVRKRSQTVPSPQSPPENNPSKFKPPPLQMQPPPRKDSASSQYYNGLVGGHNAAAATAAAAAYPRSAQLSPGLTTFEQPSEKDFKVKSEKSKMKLFSKPKHIGISSHKDPERKERPLPSPIKATSPGPSMLSRATNASSISLVDPTSAMSIYSSNNASTSTLVPLDRQRTEDKDKDKAHRHNFLSRQKHKLKDKMEDHPITLPSASSNSRPVDPHVPQSLYSFAPGSPGPTSTAFSKSVSGLDLRHGGRALREKKKEEKASAMPTLEIRRSDVDRSDRGSSTSFGSSAAHSFLAPTSSHGMSGTSGSHTGEASYINLQGFGLSNMTPEDAWDFLKAKLLIIFEGEELKMLVEDLNLLVSAHIQRCVQKHAPTILIEDLRDFLRTGFWSLEQTVRGIPDDRLVPYLVEMWLFVFGTILPYIQAVFLPLDQEFKGHGTIMTPKEAAEFWGVPVDVLEDPLSSELDVRRIVLISYRDHVILPRHDKLKAIFSRLSLENINAVSHFSSGSPGFPRPGTAGSLDPGLSSFNSQSSTLLEGSGGARSRAVSNTSAPELPSFAPPPARRQAPPDSSKVTEMVGRMLQCLSVLASVQSGDEAQTKMEGLAKELKLNWLGRGRTGRNRKGFVGTKIPAPPVIRTRSSQDGAAESR